MIEATIFGEIQYKPKCQKSPAGVQDYYMEASVKVGLEILFTVVA